MFGIHFEGLYNLPPLAARILGTLIVDSCKTGMTFEDLVVRMEASKSSVSTNLTLLQTMEKISYYTVSGDRKKYFKASPFSDRLTNYVKVLNAEKKLLDRMLAYREKTISCREEQCNLEHAREYKRNVLEMEALLGRAIENFKKIESQNL